MSNDLPLSDDYMCQQYEGHYVSPYISTLKLYIDFCPSEYIKEATPTSNSTFVSSACTFFLLQKDSKSKIKKFSRVRTKNRKISYLNEVTGMIKRKEFDFSSLCLIEDEEWHYRNGLLNTEGKMDKIQSTDVGKQASENKIASISGILFSSYVSVLYFLLIVKFHKMDTPQDVEIIIDRSPGSTADLELFKVIQQTCYNHIFPNSLYKGPINIRMLEENEEDPPGLIFADMMANIYQSWVILENVGESNKVERQAEKYKPLKYSDEHYSCFAAFRDYLANEKKCLVVVTPNDIEEIYNIIKKSVVSEEEFSEIISNFQKGEKS